MSGNGFPSRLVKPGGKTHSAPSLSTKSPFCVEVGDDVFEYVVVIAFPDDVVPGEFHAQLRVEPGRSSAID